jgi:micrococcal nuclease
VKGNDGNSGKIYHIPGSSYYDRTKPEQCFFDINAAVAAGYRPPRT